MEKKSSSRDAAKASSRAAEPSIVSEVRYKYAQLKLGDRSDWNADDKLTDRTADPPRI